MRDRGVTLIETICVCVLVSIVVFEIWSRLR